MLNVNKEDILTNIIRNLYTCLKFSEDYINNLKCHISDEEYAAAMKEFAEDSSDCARKPREISEEQIAFEAKCLLSILGNLSSVDIGEFLNLDILEVDKTLRKFLKKDEEDIDMTEPNENLKENLEKNKKYIVITKTYELKFIGTYIGYNDEEQAYEFSVDNGKRTFIVFVPDDEIEYIQLETH